MAYHRYIFTEPEKEALSNERLDIRLLYISKSRYDRNWQSILHSHAFAELFYVIHGTGVFQTENDSFPVAEDDLVLINPNVTHTEFSHGENALEYIVLGLDGISFRSCQQYIFAIHDLQSPFQPKRNAFLHPDPDPGAPGKEGKLHQHLSEPS